MTITSGFLDAIAAGLFGFGERGGRQGRRDKADSRLVPRCLCVAALLLCGWAGAGYPDAAHAGAEPGKGAVTGYDIPRFVSVRVDKANLRAGPDRYFPIRTVLTRRGMPVKVIDEFKLWRKIALHDGIEGWLHQSLITGRRTFLIVGAAVDMLDEPEAEAEVVAHLEEGALANLTECAGDWCALSVSGYEGWVPRAAGWGALPGEDFER